MIRHRPLCLFGFEALGRRRRSGVSAGELSRMEGTSRQGGAERNSKPTHQMRRTELNNYEFLTFFFPLLRFFKELPQEWWQIDPKKCPSKCTPCAP